MLMYTLDYREEYCMWPPPLSSVRPRKYVPNVVSGTASSVSIAVRSSGRIDGISFSPRVAALGDKTDAVQGRGRTPPVAPS